MAREKAKNTVETSITSKVGKSRKKTGGRGPGTPNKKTLAFVEALGNFDPVAGLKEAAEHAKENDNWELFVKICLELLKYLYPQRKAVEATLKEHNNSMAEFMQGLKEVAE